MRAYHSGNHLRARTMDEVGICNPSAITVLSEKRLTEALREFCRLADGIADVLQAELGGQKSFFQPMPSTTRH